MPETVDVRVARGAAWLDAVYPEWWTKIDVGTLDLTDCCRCVLGQVVGSVRDGYGFWSSGYSAVLDALCVLPGIDADDWAEFHGFYERRRADLAALDEAWIAEIKRRWERGL